MSIATMILGGRYIRLRTDRRYVLVFNDGLRAPFVVQRSDKLGPLHKRRRPMFSPQYCKIYDTLTGEEVK